MHNTPFFVAVELLNLVAAVVCDERAAVEALAFFGADPVRRHDGHDVRHRVADHDALPRVLRVEARVVGLGANGRGVEKHLGAEERHGTGALGVPLIPANTHTNSPEAGLPNLEARVAGAEVKRLLVARPVGDVALAVDAHHVAGVADHRDRVVVRVARALEEGHGNDNREFLAECSHLRDGFVALKGAGPLDERVVFVTAKVGALEEFGRQNHLRSAFRGGLDVREHALDVRLPIVAERALNGGDGDGSRRKNFGHGFNQKRCG